MMLILFFFFQAEDGIRDTSVTGVQTCALPICSSSNITAIARAIVADPTVMLLDEPTGQLDAKSSQEVLALLQRLNNEFNKTIVIVTHDAHAADRAKSVLHLEKGDLIEKVAVA